ncbi:Hypothetical_protein [Hexamita inflata]|uniref:Hypothetical_protein n=1 Tax=Hexamita inflata TaxID=28002 RepID=A0AA86NSV8_9EUKA|nr:Hypothetical protein HINF_LOCUS13048 [Hexamita inflata]
MKCIKLHLNKVRSYYLFCYIIRKKLKIMCFVIQYELIILQVEDEIISFETIINILLQSFFNGTGSEVTKQKKLKVSEIGSSQNCSQSYSYYSYSKWTRLFQRLKNYLFSIQK